MWDRPHGSSDGHRAVSIDHLIRRLCHAHPRPTHSAADLPKQCSLVAVGGSVKRSWAAKKRPEPAVCDHRIQFSSKKSSSTRLITYVC